MGAEPRLDAKLMGLRSQDSHTINDTTRGRDYLEAVEAGRIKDHDVLVQLSLDGAQLYHDLGGLTLA